MMHIGVVVDNEYYSDLRVSNQVKYLLRHGYRISVLCLGTDPLKPRIEEKDSLRIYRLFLKKKSKSIQKALINLLPWYENYWARQISKFISETNVDCLHVHDLYMSKAGYMGKAGDSIPMILDLHENFQASIMAFNWATAFPARYIVRPGLWKKKEEKYLSYADEVIVLSETFRDDLLERNPGLNREQIHIYPNVPDVDRMLSYPVDRTGLPELDRPVIFYFGRIGERRGIFTALEAQRILLKRGSPVNFLLIGPVDKADRARFFKSIESDLHLKDHVLHVPWIDISAFPSYISLADIGLSPLVRNPQHDSGIANKVYNYMLFEKPLVVSDCRPQQKLVHQNNCGLVFKSEDPIDLADKIEEILKNPDSAEEMGKNGKKAILRKYNIENFGNTLDKIFTKFSRDAQL